MKGEFHAPSLEHEFFPGHVNGDLWFNEFANGAFALDRLMLIRILMIVLVSAFFFFAMRKPKLIPSGVQNFAELALDFVRIHIAEDILGKKEGRRFLPLIAAIFFAVLAVNAPTVIPGLNISPSARFGFPVVLALIAYVTFIYAGVKRYGLGKYIKSSLIIPGLPPFLYLLVVPIEFVSTFILRPATLAIRLMANMLAGHLILVMLFSGTNFLFWQMNGWTLLSAGTLLFAIAFSLFELMVIFLQAYIFALLAAVYIELSLHADEH
ncbi:F0F1 ATP synthase subunit A [Corynebacterium sp. 320]|uniref:ATP synthase subunit a n=1 Tax=Corynebacterium zhongnanshanii TaxID=2768834 RepID=A0ABQ6VFN5_9CORY|nr:MULTISPECIES: F0F1 ATP synthase subunit A [Corynebacterium]KAB1503940.1 F0F1 ATP synthase subunit A [Corynebacterium sp. 320]KAB1552961.1 F0F1 ATP synthase subunit A [Corynebacterium sp. 321]KAB1553819.1 F0F1 ATP synthase subunit A [Corynebacterium sp. 319]KAB3523210.1 F0F1 ATP synthase subunit A [Corynebacterium zhongnanshanii]KAB3528076.1 F0F1 ATP synthase subunit A [Corynebacterium sp. 250]